MPFALVFWSVVRQKTLVAIACHVLTIDANLLAQLCSAVKQLPERVDCDISWFTWGTLLCGKDYGSRSQLLHKLGGTQHQAVAICLD